jgi:hypothetical protein
MNDYVRSQYLSWLVFQWEGYGDDLLRESGSRRSRTSKRAFDEYINDMRGTFHALHGLMRKGGFMAVVLGCSETALAKKGKPVQKLDEIIGDQGFEVVWKGKRRVRFRKINNTPYRSEVIWVYRK